MTTQEYLALADKDLIKAHMQAADGPAAKPMLAATAAGRVMLEANADRRARLAAAGLEMWIHEVGRDGGTVASVLLRADQKAWNGARLAAIVGAAAQLKREHPSFSGFSDFPYKPLITAVEKVAERDGLSADLRAALERWKAALLPRPLTPAEERLFGEAERDVTAESTAETWGKISAGFAKMEALERIRTALAPERRLIERIAVLLAAVDKQDAATAVPVLRIDTTDAVGILISADVARGGRASGAAWAELIKHARSLTATKPSPKWSEAAARMAANIDAKNFGSCISDWFNETGKPTAQKLVHYRGIANATLLNDCSVEILKGLAWAVVAAQRVDLAPALANLADACCKKVPDIGPRNVKVGNAAIISLAAFGDPQAAAQLSRLRLRVKHPSSRATVDKALAALSE